MLEALAISAGSLLVLGVWEVRANDKGPAYVAFMMVGVTAYLVIVRLVGLWVVRSLIRRVVLQTGSLCRSCGYNLTGNESGVCPECGEEI